MDNDYQVFTMRQTLSSDVLCTHTFRTPTKGVEFGHDFPPFIY